ncbi:dynein regulatory complex subunit 7 isoform X4 [Acanthochromis polyacanthus]|nr:dynein regulatory complex subunit 7 isoform X4 [Acanthochromis polyacanthus]XP_051805758.1 dynein regulatory complex subunit 7 isoform X4 [Acanthochromis polyacanthus]XP_051805759.1 dynein regulatory complex subunit 7 isoform X4 [Acanthochromis polyacanthus]
MAAALESGGEERTRNEEIQQRKEEEEEARTELTQLQHLPDSYKTNSHSEIQLLAIADNFQRQYSHLFPDRKPLLLCPVNECGMKKFVSTTLKPTTMVHHELVTWQGCASFVASFLNLELLEPPVDPPRHMFSSTTVLKRQRATCFEFSTLLCSLLLGGNYDAYCVSGYAVKEMCLLDQSLQKCPLLDTEAKSVISEQQQPEKKYAVKPLRDLESRFLTQQEKKKQEAEAPLLQRQKLEEESEQRPADPLRGLRVHCWVLVLAGSRRVQENFFIDPLTGNSYPTDSDNFLGIESVWNNLNYYVNMQDCSNGCAEMVFDLEDLKIWEPVLYGATSKKQEEEQSRVFEMPRSWVSYINITEQDLETRCPGGTKVIRYRKAKLERFAPGLSPDGLITQLTTYKDLDCTKVAMVKEWYQDRNDCLEEREINKDDNSTTERFKHKTTFHLLLLRCRSLTTGTEQEMEFSNTRSDELVRRRLTPHEMIEMFEGRNDFLYYRHVFFSQPVQLSEFQDDQPLPINRIVEHFHRNKSKPANNDVARRIFLVAQRQIEVTYHLIDYRFIPSRRTFNVPTTQNFSADLVCTFQVDLSEKPLGTLALYDMLVALKEHEADVTRQIRKSVEEVKYILTCREQDEKNIELQTVTAQAIRERQKMEHLAAEHERWLQEQKKDVLAPFLIQLDKRDDLSPEDATKIYQDCLAEMRNRLVTQANLIQKRYEKVTQRLQVKQQWYQENQLKLTKQEKDNYQTYCNEKTIQISAIQKRLSKCKEAADDKYRAFDQNLQRDPRLAPHLRGHRFVNESTPHNI